MGILLFYLRVLNHVTKGWSENLKPVVYIPIDGLRKEPIEAKSLSNRFKEIAHVGYPENQKNT